MQTKDKIIYGILIILVILGGYLRFYHINYPQIGYHGMKEGEYLDEAIFFTEQGDYLHRNTFMFNGMSDNTFFEEYSQMPIIPYLTTIGWKVMGSEPIWFPRLIIIMFSLLSIIVLYLLVKKLTDSEYISLLSSGLFSIMPLATFFGRIFPKVSAELVFTMLAIYFYIDYYKSFNPKYLLTSMLMVAISAMFKETFLLILIPILFITPWKQIYYSTFFNIGKHIICGILGLLPYEIINIFYNSLIIDKSRIQMEAFSIAFSRALHIDFWIEAWPPIASFLNDNFTWYYVFFTICGTMFILTKYKTIFGRLIIGYLVSLPIYLSIVSGKIQGHAYYWFVFLHIVCILSAYFIFTVGMFLKEVTKIKYVEYIALILILITIPAVQASNNRVFGTIFPGQDVIGEWLKTHKELDSRLFAVATSQTYAVCTYARMYCQEWRNESDMKYLEKKYNVNFIYIDVYRLGDIDKNTAWNYIKDNYHIVLVGLTPNNGQLGIYAIILEKGGKFNMTDIQKVQPYLAKVYDTPYGDMQYYVVEVEE